MGYNFNLEADEAELLISALQRQTSNIIGKIQGQFAEQTKRSEETEDEILVEEKDGSKGN